jgi:hypothetical protein
MDENWAVETFHYRNETYPAVVGPSRHEGPKTFCGRITERRTLQTIDNYGVNAGNIQIDCPAGV